jgi:4-hydroxybenzoate polyprenyltransferase
MLISAIGTGNPFPPLMTLGVVIIAPMMLFSYNWGIEIYLISLAIFVVTMLMMIYGYKKRHLKLGIIVFLLGFWIYSLACLLFLGAHF